MIYNVIIKLQNGVKRKEILNEYELKYFDYKKKFCRGFLVK